MASGHGPMTRSFELRQDLKSQPARSYEFFLRPWLVVRIEFEPTTSPTAD